MGTVCLIISRVECCESKYNPRASSFAFRAPLLLFRFIRASKEKILQQIAYLFTIISGSGLHSEYVEYSVLVIRQYSEDYE